MLQRDRRMGHDRPKGACRLAELLADQRQFELRAALAPDLPGVVDAVEAMFPHGAAQAIERRGRQRAVHLQLDLVRKQMLLGEGFGAAPPVQRLGRQGKIHQPLSGLATTSASSATMSSTRDERIDVDLRDEIGEFGRQHGEQCDDLGQTPDDRPRRRRDNRRAAAGA